MMKGGKDRVVSHRECEVFDKLSASTDKTFKIYPDVPHTTLWDPETPEILDVVGRVDSEALIEDGRYAVASCRKHPNSGKIYTLHSDF